MVSCFVWKGFLPNLKSYNGQSGELQSFICFKKFLFGGSVYGEDLQWDVEQIGIGSAASVNADLRVWKYKLLF